MYRIAMLTAKLNTSALKELFTMRIYLLIISLIFSVITLDVQAQLCGTHPTDEQIEQLKSRRKARQNAEHLKNNAIIQIPIVNHIIRMDDGTGGLTLQQLDDVIQELNDFYSQAEIEFVACKAVRYIDDSDWFNFSRSEDSTLVADHNIANVLNIYYANDVLSTTGSSLCGYADFPTTPVYQEDKIILKNSCAMNGSTFIHEVGHFLSLLHTHGSSSCSLTDELVDGSNCNNAGDLICDTPADPNFYLKDDGSGCRNDGQRLVNTNCQYTGTLTDANGDAFTPIATNIMSYSRTACRTTFTQGQLDQVRESAINDRWYLSCEGGATIITENIEVSTADSEDWDVITFPTAFKETPIVVVGPPSFVGTNESTVRIRNVSTTGFQIQIDEWDYLDGGHAPEQVSYIAAIPGEHDLGGMTMIAGSAEGINHTFHTVNLPAGTFTETPVVMASQVTNNDGHATSVRLRNVSSGSFQIRVQEEEASDLVHGDETLNYMAFSSGTGSLGDNDILVGNTSAVVDHDWYTIDFAGEYTDARFLATSQSTIGGDPFALRYQNLTTTSVRVKLEEENSDGNDEFEHIEEEVGYVLIGKELEPRVITENISVHTLNSNDWDIITFPTAFDMVPIVVVGPPSIAGTQQTTVRIRNVSTTGFEIQIDEWDYLDGGHVEEQLSYIAAEPGEHDLGGITMVAGSVAAVNHAFQAVSLPTSTFTASPVVMASQVTNNDGEATSIRLSNVSSNSFEIRVQEEEWKAGSTNDGIHGNETINFMAFSLGAGSLGDKAMVVGNTSAVVSHNWYTLDFGNEYADANFIATCQTTIGGDPLALRYNNFTRTSIEIKLEEENSDSNNELAHTFEEVGYVLIGSVSSNLLPDMKPEVKEATGLSMRLYPNPIKEQINLELKGVEPSSTQEMTVKIFALDGKQVYENRANSTDLLSIDVSNLPAGQLYFLQVITEDGYRAREKFLKM